MREKIARGKAIIAVALTAGMLFSGWAVLSAHFPGALRPGSPVPALEAEQPASYPYDFESGDYYTQDDLGQDDPEQPAAEPDGEYDPGQSIPPAGEESYPEQDNTEQPAAEPDGEHDSGQSIPPAGAEQPDQDGSAQNNTFEQNVLPALQPVRGENTSVMPRQDVFTIAQAFELNGYTPSRLTVSFVQLSYLPNDTEGWSQIMIYNQAHIQAVWDILSRLEVTSRGAAQAGFSTNQVAVDFSFTDSSWNWSVGVQIFGPVHILGHGPFVFAEGSSAQPLIDMFNQLAAG